VPVPAFLVRMANQFTIFALLFQWNHRTQKE
jgi:hypothetical protein